VVDVAVFKLYKDIQNQFRWRLRAVNNKVMADSGEGYINWQDAMDAIDWVKKFAPGAKVDDLTK